MICKTRYSFQCLSVQIVRSFLFVLLALLTQAPAWADNLILSSGDFRAAYENQSLSTLMRTQHSDRLAALELARRFSVGNSDLPANAGAALKFYSQAASRVIFPGEGNQIPVDQLLVPIIRASRGAASPIPDSLEANFELAVTEGIAPLQISFDGSSLTTPQAVNFAWSFGDGRVASGAQQTLIFENAGVFNVTLTVMDGFGQVSSVTRELSVLAPEVPEAPPSEPILSSPADQSVFPLGSVILAVWSPISDALAYQLQLVNASGHVLYDSGGQTAACDTNECEHSIDTTGMQAVPLVLRILARNDAGDSAWTEQTLTLVSAPSAPVIVAPQESAVLASHSPIAVSWQSVENATGFELVVHRSDETLLYASGLLPLTNSCSADGCSHLIDSDGIESGTLVLALRAINSADESEWVERTVTLLDLPTAPVIETPLVDAQLLLASMINVSWIANPAVQSYEIELVDVSGATVSASGGLSSGESCSEGSCNYSLNTVGLTTGVYSVQLRSINTVGESEWASRAVNLIESAEAPVITAPDQHSVFALNASIDISWELDESADSFQIELLGTADEVVVDAGDVMADVACSSSACGYSMNTDGLAAEAYTLRLRSTNSLGESPWSTLVLTLATTPESPMIDSLEVAALGSVVTVSWLPVESADDYEIEVIDGNEMLAVGPITTSAAGCGADSCEYLLNTTDLNAGSHTVRVRSTNIVGESEWSTQTLSLVEVPTVPINLSPEVNDELIYLHQATFTWAPVENAQKYEFHTFNALTGELAWIRDIDPSQNCLNGGDCSVTTTVELPVSPYHAWRVRAWNDAGWGPYSRSLFSMIDPENLIDDPPEAIFSTSSDTGSIPFSFYLDAAASNDDSQIVDFHWVIGDEVDVSGAELTTIEHTLNVVGTVTVSLTVTDDAGMTHTTSRELSATENFPPTASFDMIGYDEFAAGIGPLSIQFDPEESTDDDTLMEFRWDFGDGSDTVTTSSALVQTHQYANTGEYTVILEVDDVIGQTDSFSRTVHVLAANSEPVLAETDAARLLTQATFGPTLAAIDEVTSLGIDTWLDIQFSRLEPPHLDYVNIYSNGSNRAARHEIWWKRVVDGQDQLRERVAFALSQILVVSDIGYTLGNGQYGITHYYDLLRTHAFGNYRELLESVTLSPVMGTYLSMLQNAKGDEAGGTRADENFAREVLQLFSIGLTDLNIDGSSTGVPTFTQETVENFARVFTGWNYKDAGQWNRSFFDGPDRISPMEPFEDYHDAGQKTLLNGAVAVEGLSASDDLEFALDNIFNHPNVGPFIGRQLIMRLVTSNPSPEYIERVALTFNNNGFGIRGDLGAVVKAILTDPEARQITGDAYGKLREPVLRIAHLWRAFNVTPGAHGGIRGDYNTYSPANYNIDFVTGQAVLKSPSVFNFYKPEYAPQGLDPVGHLVAPEFEILTAGNEISTTNRIGDQINRHYLGTPHVADLNPSYLDFTTELSLAHDADELLDHLDLLLTNGAMSVELRDLLTQHIDSLDTTPTGLSQRVRDAVTLIMASPDYMVQM